MKPVIVLAWDGELDAATIPALASGCAADVVTATVDVGQSRDVRAVRDLALAAGAVRAYVVDAVDDFVRRCVLPALQSPLAGAPVRTGTATLAYPVIAAHLVDVAGREGTQRVAHAGGEGLTAAIHALDASLQVLTVDTARQPSRAVPSSARHLLQRPVADPAIARGIPANLEIEFDGAVPVALNGVPLTPAELMESLSLIGGQHGIGHAESAAAPGALVLEAAYRALDRESGVVRIELLDGRHRVLSAAADPARSAPRSPAPVLVNHA